MGVLARLRHVREQRFSSAMGGTGRPQKRRPGPTWFLLGRLPGRRDVPPGGPVGGLTAPLWGTEEMPLGYPIHRSSTRDRGYPTRCCLLTRQAASARVVIDLPDSAAMSYRAVAHGLIPPARAAAYKRS